MKNIKPEHVLRALQELHLDDYLPFLISDDHNVKLQDLLKAEKKKGAQGITLPLKQVVNEERNQNYRESMVGQMLNRLSEQT